MTPSKGDAVGVIEASYDLEATDARWVQELTERLARLFRPDLGMLGYRVRCPDGRGWVIEHVAKSESAPPGLVGKIGKLCEALEAGRTGRGPLVARALGPVVQKVFRVHLEEPVDLVLRSERRYVGPRWLYALSEPSPDQLCLCTPTLEATADAYSFIGGLRETPTLDDGTRALAVMLMSHVEAGARLRRRMTSASVSAPEGGAVLDADGRVVHAEGAASDAGPRSQLEAAAAAMDRARTTRAGRGPDAVAIWEGLVDGRWSLVEAFDADGKRFLLAHRNAPKVRDLRALTEIETQVVGLAVRGCTDKLIGYTLGIARSTAAGHLASAMKKLRIERRVDLVRFLGPRFPERAI